MVDPKVAGIPGLNDSEKNRLETAESSVTADFKTVDQAFSSKSAPSVSRSIRQLSRSYSNLSKVIASLAASHGSASGTVAVAVRPPATAAVSAPAETTGTVQTDPQPLGSPADVTFYADSFEGNRTSLGDQFSQSNFSAARCDVTLGKLVQVIANGKSVIVKANDRPDCSRHPSLADLSTKAFQILAPLSKGRISGSVVELGNVPKDYVKTAYPTDAFAELGVTLSEGIPNTYLPGETLRMTGNVTDGKKDSLLFLKTPSGKKISVSYPVDSNGAFDYEYPLDESGEYEMVVASGMGFSTNKVAGLTVLPDSAIAGRMGVLAKVSGYPPFEPHFERHESSDLSPIVVLPFPDTGENVFKTLRISQEGRETIVRRSMGDVALLPSETQAFDATKPVDVRITVSRSSTRFSMDASPEEVEIYSGKVPIVSSYSAEKKEDVSVTPEPSGIRLSVSAPASGTPIRGETYLTLPSGDVMTEAFPNDSLDSNGYLQAGKKSVLSVPLTLTGKYLLEVMYSNGFAAYNAPFTFGSPVVATLPNEYDGASKDVGTVDAATVSADALRFVNALRTKVGKTNLGTDADLTRLAQFKAEDMADHNYVGHDDSKGEKITGTAKRAGVALLGGVGENVADGSVSTDFLLAGLALSGGHRANMLGEWTKMGAAAVEKNGLTYYVQVFAD